MTKQRYARRMQQKRVKAAFDAVQSEAISELISQMKDIGKYPPEMDAAFYDAQIERAAAFAIAQA